MAIVSLEQRVARLESILGLNATKSRQANANIAATESDYTATRNYTVGELILIDNTLYKVTKNVPNGGSIVPNGNVVATKLSAEIADKS